jgi:hypothetical protein
MAETGNSLAVFQKKKKKKKYILTVYSSTILLQFKLAWRKHQKLAASMQNENWMKS